MKTAVFVSIAFGSLLSLGGSALGATGSGEHPGMKPGKPQLHHPAHHGKEDQHLGAASGEGRHGNPGKPQLHHPAHRD